MSTQGFPGGGVYRIVLFGFVGADRAAEVMAELEAGQELAGHSIVAHAVVERDARGGATRVS
jgi:hypothetical protein